MKVQDTGSILDLINKQQQPDSDQERQNKQLQRQQEAIQKDFKVMKRLATCDLKETTEEQKDKILTTRFNKFYLYNLKKNKIQDYQDQRPEVDFSQQDVIVNFRKLLVYGTDFMNKKKIEDYFQLRKEETIRTVNCSCSEITVGTPERVIEILEKVLLRKDELENLAALKWLALKPYYEQGVERKIEGRLGTNREVVKKSKGTKQYIQQETKKEFYKQSLAIKNRIIKDNPRRYNNQRKDLSIFQKKFDVLDKCDQDVNKSNLSFRAQEPIAIELSDDQEGAAEVSQSINNFDHSMELDISKIHSVSHPDIYDQPQNIHKFDRFKKYSYKDYQKQQEEKEKEKNKEIQVIVLDEQ